VLTSDALSSLVPKLQFQRRLLIVTLLVAVLTFLLGEHLQVLMTVSRCHGGDCARRQCHRCMRLLSGIESVCCNTCMLCC
jgi:hypothetical protein